MIRLIDSLRDGDEVAISNRTSRQPGFERFGTDPAELWQDGEDAARVWIQQVRETGGFPWRLVSDVHAIREGNVGWAGARAEFDGSEGPVELRILCVLHLEHGEWKIVHWHGSVPSPNEEHGFFLTKSVDEIADAVSESRPDLSASSAPDGTVTIAFTDIEDSMRLNAFLGDQRWLEVLRAHNEVITRVTEEHAGTVVKGQGDGFMLVFASATGARVCAGDRTRHRRNVPRSGLADPGSGGAACGETVREADDFFGHCGRLRCTDRVRCRRR